MAALRVGRDRQARRQIETRCRSCSSCESSAVTGPLAQFQHAAATEADLLRLATVVNEQMSPRLDDARLLRACATAWTSFAEALSSIGPATDAPRVVVRSERDMLIEVLELVRAARRALDRCNAVSLHRLGGSARPGSRASRRTTPHPRRARSRRPWMRSFPRMCAIVLSWVSGPTPPSKSRRIRMCRYPPTTSSDSWRSRTATGSSSAFSESRALGGRRPTLSPKATSLSLREPAPDPDVDLVCHCVLETLGAHRALLADAKRGVDSQRATREVGVRIRAAATARDIHSTFSGVSCMSLLHGARVGRSRRASNGCRNSGITPGLVVDSSVLADLDRYEHQIEAST